MKWVEGGAIGNLAGRAGLSRICYLGGVEGKGNGGPLNWGNWGGRGVRVRGVFWGGVGGFAV